MFKKKKYNTSSISFDSSKYIKRDIILTIIGIIIIIVLIIILILYIQKPHLFSIKKPVDNKNISCNKCLCESEEIIVNINDKCTCYNKIKEEHYECFKIYN